MEDLTQIGSLGAVFAKGACAMFNTEAVKVMNMAIEQKRQMSSSGLMQYEVPPMLTKTIAYAQKFQSVKNEDSAHAIRG